MIESDPTNQSLQWMSLPKRSILSLLNGDNFGFFNRELAHKIGLHEAIIFSELVARFQFLEKQGNLTEIDGEKEYFQFTMQDLQDRTCLGRKAQDSTLNHLIKMGWISKKNYGLPNKRYFRLHIEKLWELDSIQKKFNKLSKRDKLTGPKGTSSEGQKEQSVYIYKTPYETKKIRKEKHSPPAQTTPRSASRTATTSKITLDKDRRGFDGITKEDLEAWKTKFSAIHVEHQIDLCAEWALSNHRKNYRKSIFTWLNNIQNTNTTPFKGPVSEEKEFSESDVRSNENKALEWEETFSRNGTGGQYCIQASGGKVVFVMPNNEGYMVNYSQPQKEYEKKCMKALSRMQILNGKN